MRYRALDANGDYTFGQGQANFLINSPAAAGQAVETRLGLVQGSWFLNIQDGTPYLTDVVGAGKRQTADMAIRAVILETQGITNAGLVNLINKITNYSSLIVNRKLSIAATLDTIFGITDIQQVLG